MFIIAGPILACGQETGKSRTDFNIAVETQLKDVTATGPYPFYISFRPLLVSTRNRDIKNLFEIQNRYAGSDLFVPRRAWGYNLDAGVRVAKTLIIEFNYTQLLRRSNNAATDLRISQRAAGLRLGGAFGIYYPLSIQFCAGFVTNTSEFTIIEKNAGTDNKRKLTFSESLLKGRFGGDFALRLVVMDPVGAGGGIGFFVELRQLFFANRLNYTPYVRTLDQTTSEQFRSDSNYRLFSVGLTAPLALRSHVGD